MLFLFNIKSFLVSVRTVDAHKGNIFKKLKISSTVELIRYAVKAGLYTADSQ